ncbi:CcmD family protein [Spirosoma rhododendri]|uniref:CcmD family protein n=1 Tax=Spirosoma rhododendri TaxID=2728024 RepID=A0A7L5DQ21_9BACT|nr:CcmD family protein [Spirosoma rhododendri]QJD80496.1 CcmD family protein [Spirosoma rhododendri]
MRPLHFLTGLAASLLLTTQSVLAQQPVADGVEMADRLRADGKIWVVVAVIAAVFAGIIVYLVRLDMRLGKLEKDVQDTPQHESDVRIR